LRSPNVEASFGDDASKKISCLKIEIPRQSGGATSETG